VERPVWSRQASPQRVLQPPVTPFHHTIRLWVEGSGQLVLDTKLLAQGGPDGRGELCTLV
jgi:hypothetical protein